MTGDHYVGGLVGSNRSGRIAQSYSIGSASGDLYTGGLTGSNIQCAVLNWYCVTYVTGRDGLGGLIGLSREGTVRNSFWDTEVSKLTISAGGLGKATQALKYPETFIGWGDGKWTLYAGQDYPHLGWEGKPGDLLLVTDILTGSGDMEDPFLIRSPAELRAIGWCPSDWDKIFALTADINLDGTNLNIWQPIGMPGFLFTFTGQFQGNGFSIRHFKVSSPGDNYIGLFGMIGFADTRSSPRIGKVQDLVIIDAHVSGYDMTGILAGKNQGEITNCHVTGCVEGHYGVGGLVGWNRGLVSDSSADVEVDADAHYDSLLGYTLEHYPK